MKLTYYGTAAAEGWPALFCLCPSCERARAAGGRNIRTRSQAAVDGRLLIDLPPDTYHHVLSQGLDLTRFENLLITHAHSDHFCPSELWCRSRGIGTVIRPEAPVMTVCGSPQVGAKLASDGGADPERVKFFELPLFLPTRVGAHTVTALPADHDDGAGSRIHIISDGVKTLLYAHDTGLFPDESMDYIRRSGVKFDFVSLDDTGCSNGWLHGHMGLVACRMTRAALEECGSAGADTRFALNHFSHNGVETYDEMTALVGGEFIVSYDGLTVEF